MHFVAYDSALYVFCASGPSEAFSRARNVSIIEANTTALVVEFEPPALLSRNGLISHYNVKYIRQAISGQRSLGTEMIVRVNVPESVDEQNRIVRVRLINLLADSLYNILIQACVRRVGCSSYDFGTEGETLAAGKRLFWLIMDSGNIRLTFQSFPSVIA